MACDTYLAANTVGVNASYTYSSAKYITSTWSVGFDLGIDSGDLASASASAGFSFSYSQGTTTGSSTGISQTCGPLTGAQGLFSCGMEIQPGCYGKSPDSPTCATLLLTDLDRNHRDLSL